MKLTKEWLQNNDACEDGIDFVERNKLIGFPLDRLSEVVGDYKEYIAWITHQLQINNTSITEHCDYGTRYVHCIFEGFETWTTYDHHNNIIHYRDSNGNEETNTHQYDDRNNLIHTVSSHGDQTFYEYDDCNNLIHYKTIDNTWVVDEGWYEYDNRNNCTQHTYQNEYKINYEYDHNNNIIHVYDASGDHMYYEYDDRGNQICSTDSEGSQCKAIYDEHNNIIFEIDIDGVESNHIIEYYNDGQLKRYDDLLIPYFEK